MRFLLFALLLCLATTQYGCGPSANPMAPTGEKTTEAAKTADVEIQSIEPGLDRAEKALVETYAGFLEREPIGFGPGVWDALVDDLRDRIVDFKTLGASIKEGEWREVLRNTLPLWLTVLFIIALALIDRPAMRVARRWQARAHVSSNIFFTELSRVFIIVFGRVVSIGILVLLSYFPIQAVFDQAPWSRVATFLLWLVLAFRVSQAIIVASFGLGIVDVTDAHASRLKSFSLWALRLVIAWSGLLYTMEVLGWQDNVQAFGRLTFRATLALIPLYLYVAKGAVADLLPDAEGSPVYGGFRRFIIRNYYPILTVTIALLTLRAVGFTRASDFILGRGYAIFFLVFFALLGASRLHAWLTRRREVVDSREQRELFKGLTYTLRVAGAVAILWGVLKLVELWEPLVLVLKIPFLAIGGTTISVFKIMTALFVLGGAILFARLVKAVLIAKVYPALNVDVGVGYAVNTLVNYALIVIGFFVAITSLGVNLSALTVVVASLGVGIGFGLQTLTENLISGFILLFGRSVKKGDIITAGDLYGRVEEVGARSVLVKTPDNYDLLIPSKEIVGARIVNWSYHDSLVRLHVPVGVTYSANPREVEKVLIAAATEHANVLEEPVPEVWLKEFGNSSVNFELLVYFNCREVTKERLIGQLNFIIWDKLAEAGIEIPFPQRDLHIRSGGFAEPVAQAVIDRLERSRREGEDATAEKVEESSGDEEEPTGPPDDEAEATAEES